MNDLDNILIDDFLNGKLSETETNRFLERAKSDLEFREKFKLEKQLSEALDEKQWSFIENIKSPEVQEFENLFKSEETQKLEKAIKDAFMSYKSSNVKNVNRRLIFTVAAMIAIIISVISLKNFNNPSANELFVTYFDSSDLPSLVVRGNENDSLIVKAQNLYSANDYKSALILFNDIITSSNSNKAILYLYKGVSQMELNQFHEAETTFNELINSGLMDATKGYWFKALLFLKMNDPMNSKNVLEKIVSENMYNHIKANEILQEM